MTERPLRFVHVTTFFPPDAFGGDAVQVHRLVMGLGARGHDVRVVHSPEAFEAGHGGRTEGLLREPGVDVVPVMIGRRGLMSSYLTGRPVGFSSDLQTLIRDADVVHFHNPSLIGGPGAVLLAGDEQLVAYTAHEHWLLCPTHVLFRYSREPCEKRTCVRCTLQHRRPPQLWRWTSLLPRALDRIDVLLTPSEFTARRHRDMYPNTPTEVLRHAPPEPAHVAAVDGGRRHPRDFILFAGRIEPIKGALWLVEALREDPGLDVVIAGDGTQVDALQKAADGLAHIHVIGKVPHGEVLRLARDARALVIPSVGYETSGGVGLEAMALGTPVLVRDLGALPELILRGGGLVFSDATELRTAIRRLVDEPALVARLSREAAVSADPAAGDVAYFTRYFELLAEAATRRGNRDLAVRLEDAARVAAEG